MPNRTMYSLDGCEARSARFRNVALPPLAVAGQNSLRFGFRGGPESADECRTRSREIRYSPSCLDLGLAGQLACEAELEAPNPSYHGAAILALTGITVLGDGIWKAQRFARWSVSPKLGRQRAKVNGSGPECPLYIGWAERGLTLCANTVQRGLCGSGVAG
jgi:hypothetical protein